IGQPQHQQQQRQEPQRVEGEGVEDLPSMEMDSLDYRGQSSFYREQGSFYREQSSCHAETAPCKGPSALRQLAEKRVASGAQRRRRRGIPAAQWLLSLHSQLSKFYDAFLQRKYLHLLRAAQLRGAAKQRRTRACTLWGPSRFLRAFPATTRARCTARLGVLQLATLYDRWRLKRNALSRWLAFLAR
ncbi:hypothetical protein B484DRAFT_458625, partial [Ochromonadaceae sp. CCMP2298]